MAYKRESPIHMYANTNSMDEKNKVGPKVGGSVSGEKFLGGESNNSYIKPGGKATGSMKDYKIGSQARRDEYTARGWKQDATTKGTKGLVKQKAKTIKPIKSKGLASKELILANSNHVPGTKGVSAEDLKSRPPAKKKAPKLAAKKATAPKSTKPTKSQKLRAKGEKALASGNSLKARRIRKRYDRAVAREAKK